MKILLAVFGVLISLAAYCHAGGKNPRISSGAPATSHCSDPRLVYYPVTQRCYIPENEEKYRELIGIQNRTCATVVDNGNNGYPCGSDAYLRRVTGTSLAECKCLPRINLDCRDFPRVFSLRNKTCYPLFSQGPCPQGHWLVPSINSKALCRARDCPFPVQNPRYNAGNGSQLAFEDYYGKPHSGALPQRSSFLFQGKCFVTQTRAFCGPGQTVDFIGGLPNPVCLDKRPFKVDSVGSASITGQIACPSGQVRDQFDNCSFPPQTNDYDV